MISFLLKSDMALCDFQGEVCPVPEAGKKCILLRRVRIGPAVGGPCCFMSRRDFPAAHFVCMGG